MQLYFSKFLSCIFPLQLLDYTDDALGFYSLLIDRPGGRKKKKQPKKGPDDAWGVPVARHTSLLPTRDSRVMDRLLPRLVQQTLVQDAHQHFGQTYVDY